MEMAISGCCDPKVGNRWVNGSLRQCFRLRQFSRPSLAWVFCGANAGFGLNTPKDAHVAPNSTKIEMSGLERSTDRKGRKIGDTSQWRLPPHVAINSLRFGVNSRFRIYET